jgi:hypothetical protein
MVIHAPFFVIALLLLWFPRQWMRRGKVLRWGKRNNQRKGDPWERRESGDPRVNARWEFRKARNYFDLLRGGAGAWALVGGHGATAALTLEQTEEPRARTVFLGVQFAVLLIGVAVQTGRRERGRLGFAPPIFYLAGVSFALCGPWAALLAFALIWALNPLLAGARTFLTMYAAVAGAFGWFLAESDQNLCVMLAVLCLFPVVASLLARRPLVVFSRRGFRVGPGSA